MLPTLGDALQESWKKVSNRLRKKKTTLYPMVVPLDLVAEFNDNFTNSNIQVPFLFRKNMHSQFGA